MRCRQTVIIRFYATSNTLKNKSSEKKIIKIPTTFLLQHSCTLVLLSAIKTIEIGNLLLTDGLRNRKQL